jgi:hypothetical protein
VPPELTEHEQAMLRVAETGDPNDPAENTTPAPVELPSDPKPAEEDPKPAEEAPKPTEGEDTEQAEEDPKPAEGDAEDEELTPEQEELAKLRQEAKEREVYEALGGKKEYAELREWASTNVPEAQLEVYNRAVTEGDSATAIFASTALRDMRELANIKKHGYQGEVTNPSNAPNVGNTGYESTAQMQADMVDPRYKADPAYRALVATKIQRTPAGVL